MTIDINLKANPFIKMPCQLYTHEKEVILNITSEIYSLNTLSVSLSDGKHSKTIIIHGEPLDITEFFRAGKLDIQFTLIENGEKLKTWRVEPLYLKEIDEEILSVPAIDKMQEELEQTKAELEKLKTALVELYSKTNETI